MSIFSKKKEEKKTILVFDVGSYSVGGAVFEFDKDSLPEIISSHIELINLEKEINADNFLDFTIKSLEKVASKLCLKSTGKPEKLFCVLSSPWYASELRKIKLEKSVPFVFNLKLANSLIQKEITIFEEERLPRFYSGNDNVVPIEFKNIKTSLNGYATHEPFNKKAKKLEMDIFVSMCGNKILDKIREVVFHHFHTKDLKFLSFAMTSFSVLRDLFGEEQNFLIMDIAGEMTDVSLVKEDVLSGSISYPFGRNTVIRMVAQALNCELSEASSFVSLYKDKHASVFLEKKMKNVMKKIRGEWLDGFSKSVYDLSLHGSIPSTIFLAVDKDMEDFFSKLIESEEYGQQILTDSKFKIVPINPEILHGFVKVKNSSDYDPFLMLETIFINRFIC